MEENERKMELARAEKKRIGSLMNEVYSKIKKLNEEIDEYKGDLDNIMKNKEET